MTSGIPSVEGKYPFRSTLQTCFLDSLPKKIIYTEKIIESGVILCCFPKLYFFPRVADSTFTLMCFFVSVSHGEKGRCP